MRVIQECEVEALLNRAMPLSFALGLAAFYGVKKGFLQVCVHLIDVQ